MAPGDKENVDELGETIAPASRASSVDELGATVAETGAATVAETGAATAATKTTMHSSEPSDDESEADDESDAAESLELSATVSESSVRNRDFESTPGSGSPLPTPGAIDAMGETVATPNPDVDSGQRTRNLGKGGRSDRARALSAGDKLGRYIVLELLGAGGMGEVYAAYDPELDRRIALKVIHPAMQDADSHSIARGRLLREAKAIAQLSHPNVISVFDVGTVGDDVYVAMEFIDGSDLRQWRKRETRSWDEITEVFAAAGAGLAAAHDSGMVHRDFKPDNVLIGNDGRVRVIDFGLAARRDAGDAEPVRGRAPISEEHETLIEQSRRGDMVTTQAGSVLGTPAYMAPEQFDGASTDARTDQFNFAVALYESLFGERPFAGEDYTTLAGNVTSGTRKPLPKAADVPGWLTEVVGRGLSKDPEQRYATMHELVAALVPPETFWRRHRAAIAAIAGIALIGGALATQVLAGSDDEQACTGLDRDLAGVWDDGRKQSVKSAILATELPYAEDAWQRVDRALTSYTERWVAARVDACEDSAVRKEQSQAMLGKRMDCLDRRLHELDAVVTVIAAADDSVVANAAQAAASLTPVDRCSNKSMLANTVDEKSTMEMDRELARVKALDAAGKYQEALDRATEALSSSRSQPGHPREARALLWVGRMQSTIGSPDEAIETLFEAVRVADDSGDKEGEAEAWVSVIGHVAVKLDRPAEAMRWVEFARLAIEQAGGGDIELQAKLHHQTGIVHFDQKHYDEALAEFRAAVALYERSQGKDYFRAALSAGMAGSTLRRMNRNEEAAEQHMAALKALEAALGPEHPRVASMLNNVANTLGRVDKMEQAKEFYERSLSIKRKTVGPGHESIAPTLVNLGGLEERMGNWEDAITRYQHALDIRRAKLSADHPAIPRTLQSIARVHRKMGALKLALKEEQNVLLRYESIYGAGHDLTNNIRVAVCDVLHRSGNLSAAKKQCDMAVEALDEAPDQRNLAWALTYSGRVYVSLGQAETALAQLERALKIREEFEGTERYLAETNFALATAVAAAGKDSERAKRLATEARDVLAAAPPGDAEFLPEIEAFLAGEAK